MIKGIQLGQGVLTLGITCARRPSPGQSKRRVEFDFCESGTVTEIHRSELVDFFYAIDAENPYEVCDLIFKLVGTETRISRINFDLLNSPSEGLQGSAATDVLVDLASGTSERTSGEEQVTFSLG